MLYDPRPAWSQVDEAQLKWNSIELQAYRNPGFGPTDRKINTSEALPTALHSWGAAVMSAHADAGLRVPVLSHSAEKA